MSKDRILVVDDEPTILDLYTRYLEDNYEVMTAATGEEALEAVSAEPDVILLDRIMPGMSGEKVLSNLRDQGFDGRVAMVTAVKPETDVIELGFDDYVVKPVSPSELHNLVDSLLHWREYDTQVREYFRTARKVALLEEELAEETLTESEEYQQLLDQLDDRRTEAEQTLANLDGVAMERLDITLDDGGDALAGQS